MLMKIFSTGEGNGYGPVEYLCSENPFKSGKREIPPQVLGGSPAIIMRQIDAVPFKQKYTSGVFSFAPEDRPTDEQISKVIEATEELAFAGLPSSSRSILWVKHEHTGRTELHFVIPRQEVNSGKSFNAFPPGWQKKFDPLRDRFNYKYGWARPDDPQRARHWQPDINAKILCDARRRKKPNMKTELSCLTDDLGNMALQGKLNNRIEIVSELRRRGYGITRQGKDYITILDNTTGKRTRLKGTLFEEDFNGPEWAKSAIKKASMPASEKNRVDPALAAEADARLREAITNTAIYNRNRYDIEEAPDEYATDGSAAQCEGQAFSRGDAEKARLSDQAAQGADASKAKPFDGEADETDALHPEQGLGKSAANGSGAAPREDAQSALREIPVPEQPFSGMGRGTGERPPLEGRNRGDPEQISEGRDRASQDPDSASARDHRRESGEPGRHDEIDIGESERIAGKGRQSGEFWRLLQSIRRNSRKLEDRLLAIQMGGACASPPPLGDSALNLDMEPLAQAGQRFLGHIAAVCERNMLKGIYHSLPNFRLASPSELLDEGQNAIQILRQLAEINLLKKINKNLPTPDLPPIGQFSREVENLQDALIRINEHKLLQKLVKAVPILELPDLTAMKRQADFLRERLNQTHDTKVVARIVQAERERQEIIDLFMRQAKWAGSDLERWEDLQKQYHKRPKRLKVIEPLLKKAHNEFHGIFKHTEKLNEVRELCGDNPLLLRELALLEVEMAKYYEKEAEAEVTAGTRPGPT